MGINFNRKQCVHSLRKIGFYKSGSGRGNHDKFISLIKNSNPPFIMVPRHNNIHCQGRILQQLKLMGGDSLVNDFMKNL